jgi:hypothetical protein
MLIICIRLYMHATTLLKAASEYICMPASYASQLPNCDIGLWQLTHLSTRFSVLLDVASYFDERFSFRSVR